MSAPKGRRPWNYGTSKGWLDKRGYRWIYISENGKRRAIKEHRHIYAQHIGRKLSPEEIVHHINGDPSDNRIENLELTTAASHTMHHCAGSKRPDAVKRTLEVMANYRQDMKRLQEINTALLEALEELTNYTGGADNALEDEYVMERVCAAIAKARREG